MPDRLATAHINLQHYSDNLSSIRKIVGQDIQIMAVVKANAYGHGIEKIAEAAVSAGVSYVGVVSLGELKQLRNSGITAPILILNYLDADSIGVALDYNGAITIMDEAIVDAAESAAAARNTTMAVHLKIDTGMHRAGCDPDNALTLAQKIERSTHLNLQGVFTHLAESENADTLFTQRQLHVFTECLAQLHANNIDPPLVHAANSAATIALPESRFTLVRPGLISYGINPFGVDHPASKLVHQNFKPALSLKTQVVLVHSIQPGETVGYNRRWEAKRPTQLALLPIGYGDGWRRGPHSAEKVLIHGQFAPIVGNISMDQTVVDVTDVSGVSVGDEVVLIGHQGTNVITADDIAAAYQTISYEVVTALSGRIVREYHDTTAS